MKAYSKNFYTGKQWRKISKLYMSSIHYVCERCGGVAEICHHKKYITPANINDTNITLNLDNLEGLCMDCHNKEHRRGKYSSMSRITFDEAGNIAEVRESKEIIDFKKAVQKIEQLDLPTPGAK